MYIKSLHIKNIGPFREAYVNFPTVSHDQKMPVTIITGENGTGKSIIIDAIRASLMGLFGINRYIVANKDDFESSLTTTDNGDDTTISANTLYQDRNLNTRFNPYSTLLNNDLTRDTTPNWIIDYWNSEVSNDNFKINNLSEIEPQKCLLGSLLGNTSNVDLTKFICSIDYLRSSDEDDEKKTGEYVYKIIKDILNSCLVDGEYKYVARRTFSPTFNVKGHDVTIDKLSSGNLMLMNHLIGLLIKSYSICTLKNISLKEMCKLPGVLLIDEVENHLHPKWQKKTLGIIQSFFPNLQIIMTTHSPFVVSSVSNARIYVCESRTEYSVIEDHTSDYSNLPIDEVLATKVFNVGPFNEAITDLLKQRKEAVKANDQESVKQIEKDLLTKNKEYFSFLDLDKLSI